MHIDKTAPTCYSVSMRKIRAKEEKRERNEEYAKRFQTKKDVAKKRKGTFANWCRTAGHPANCRCVYR